MNPRIRKSYMAQCVHCKVETENVTLIEGIGKIAVCEKCMTANDVSTEKQKLRDE